MLQIIRNRVTGWIATVIVALLIIPFAFWGINYYFGQGGEVTAVSVNGNKISLRQYQQSYQSTRQQWQSILGQNIPPEREPALKQATLDNLISRELIQQVNAAAGLSVSDRQVRETIKAMEYFQGEDGFSPLIYESALNRIGISAQAFEQQMRQDMTAEQLQSALIESAFITQKETEALAQLKNQTRNLNYALLSSDKLKESIEVTDEEITDYYETEGLQFMEPEKIKIAYVELSLSKIAEDVVINDDALRDYYEKNAEDYSVDEQRSVKQIFIKTGEKASEELIKEAKEKAQRMLDLVKSGKTFEEVAEEHSDDPGPQLEVSEHGLLSPGIMEPEVDEVMFSMEQGQISDPIQSKQGIQVLKLMEIKGGVSASFEDAREDVEKDYRKSEAETTFFELADRLANLSYEHPDTLVTVSEELGLELHVSDFFSRREQGNDLLRNPKIIDASFSEDVLIGGNNSEPIELDDNHMVVLRVAEHVPERKKALDDVRDGIITKIKYERAAKETREKGEQVIEELKSGTAMDEVATRHEFTWLEANGVKRDDVSVNRSILRTAFRLGRPQAGEPVYGGSSLGSGDYAVIVVKEVNDADPGDLKEEELKAVENQLQRLISNDNWALFVKDLRARADIRIYSDKL